MNSSVLYKTAQLIHEIWEMADEVGIFQVTKRIHDIIAQWGELFLKEKNIVAAELKLTLF